MKQPPHADEFRVVFTFSGNAYLLPSPERVPASTFENPNMNRTCGCGSAARATTASSWAEPLA